MGRDVKSHKRRPAPGQTSVAEILGRRTSRRRVGRKWAEHHKQLTDLKKHFLREKRANQESGTFEISSFGEHMADAATDSYDRDWALAMLTSAQNILYEIEEALNRIAEGTYGICELSGAPIEAARLKAIPWTRFSALAQSQLEARGVSPRTQLGERGSWSRAERANGEDDEKSEELAGAKGRGSAERSSRRSAEADAAEPES